MAKAKSAESNDSNKEKSALYTQAIKVLRERHTEEFTEIISGLYAEKGLTYKRRLTQAEREERERAERLARGQARLDSLLADYPELQDQVTSA